MILSQNRSGLILVLENVLLYAGALWHVPSKRGLRGRDGGFVFVFAGFQTAEKATKGTLLISVERSSSVVASCCWL